MKKKLLQYEFWETADKYYARLFSRVNNSDLSIIRKYLAQKLLSRFPVDRKLIWIDIGSGDGFTLIEVFKKDQNFRNRQITLFVVEPSPKAIKILKSNLEKYKNIKVKIIKIKFDLSLFENKKYDVISFLHSSYNITNSKKSFKEVYYKAHNSLRKNGMLLVQSIKSDSVFRKLETRPYPYSIFSCGDKTCGIFKNLWNHASCKEFKTRFDATSYLSKNLTKPLYLELKQFYLFLEQNFSAVTNVLSL